ncbi:MAG: dienelactone hydrolase family protein [Anaerolineae bacterium]|nr:dienelactone hydrolase family protein [Anaerolineae bacterium]
MNTETLITGKWTLRIRRPEGAAIPPVILLLHGWTGDENAMWIFASKLPEHYLLIAPRAPHIEPRGGYSWHPPGEKGWPSLDDFRPAVDALLELLAEWPASVPADFSNLRLAGFSQGAALAYSFALLHTERVRALAALAGFLPDGAATFLDGESMRGKPIYISHGSKDELVPVARARQAVQLLDAAGADVAYCESDVGHKLSADCFRGMEMFFQ